MWRVVVLMNPGKVHLVDNPQAARAHEGNKRVRNNGECMQAIVATSNVGGRNRRRRKQGHGKKN